jgi:hypothetical protein
MFGAWHSGEQLGPPPAAPAASASSTRSLISVRGSSNPLSQLPLVATQGLGVGSVMGIPP